MANYGYTKLASSIVTSSIWVGDHKLLRVWIAMLALADREGIVEGAPPGFANLCCMSLEDMNGCLDKLKAPDSYSRDQAFEGRRIEDYRAPARGGWKILNYEKFRDGWGEEERRAYKAKWQAKYRQRKISETKAKYGKSKAG